MSSTPEDTDRPAATPAAQPKTGEKTGKHRFKPQLSCTFCRNRKLKCDRNLPCQNCTKRNQSSSCVYVHATRDKPSQVQKSANSAKEKDIHSQIRHLEDLVVSLMNHTANKTTKGAPQVLPNQESSTASPDAHSQSTDLTPPDLSPGSANQYVGDTAASIGRINLEDDQPSYVGSSHWTAILDNIAGLKDKLGATDIESPTMPPSSSSGPALLVGSVRAATRSEILMSLPSRSVVDALVETYFNTPDFGATMVHAPSFRKECLKFWNASHEVPVMWIGELFGILCLSLQFLIMSDDPTAEVLQTEALRDPKETINLFREKIVQCLVLGNYTEPGPYTVETMCLYYVSDHFRTLDTQFGAWMVFGLIVRAALRLGYHRDASHYSTISLCRGEMQRRVWAVIVYMDLQTSLQVGLPRMLNETMYDTQMPHNYLDEDFDEDTVALPPIRADDDVTSVLYSNTKNQITRVLGDIVDLTNSAHAVSYEEFMRLDERLHVVYQQSPALLKVLSVEDLNTGSAILRLRKFSVDLTFQKARCILHRKFFIPAKNGIEYQYPYSTKACVDAAMRILQAQLIMYGETQTGKMLQGYRWRTSSLITHDFLLAAMIVGLYLSHGIYPQETGDAKTSMIKVNWTKEELTQVLQETRKIWSQPGASTSAEAMKANRALTTILKRVAGLDDETVDGGKGSKDVEMPMVSGPIPTKPSISPRPPTTLTPQSTTSSSLSEPWSLTPIPFITQVPYSPPNTTFSPTAAPFHATPAQTQQLNNQTSTQLNNQFTATESLDWEMWDRQFCGGNGGVGEVPNEMQWGWAPAPPGQKGVGGTGGVSVGMDANWGDMQWDGSF